MKTVKRKKYSAFLITVSFLLLCVLRSGAFSDISDAYEVVWDSPSQNSWGSMPIGNGDIGLNVWVEENGDLQFYISKTDAWSENCRLLKLGKVRVKLTPNPFAAGQPFTQTLDVKKGKIRIEAGASPDTVSLKIWLDANHPVIHVDGNAANGVDVQVDLEIWRDAQRTLEDREVNSAYGIRSGPVPIVVEPDTIISDYTDRLMWCHRNERSIWQENMDLQVLGHMTSQLTDPLLNRTFGAAVKGANLAKTTDTRLQSSTPVNTIDISVYPLTEQTSTLDEWKTHLNDAVTQLEALGKAECLLNHYQWWANFWDRHYIHVTGDNDAFTVTRAYVLQRFINACSGRGNSPIKFNGSIFNVDLVESIGSVPAGYDSDFREWGGPYWFQNTRLPYWTMLYSGDLEMLEPWFKMYMDALPVAEERSQAYYGHAGAFYPETMYFWGTYVGDNYGWDRTGLDDGYVVNNFIRYYWSGGLELSLIMLDYYAFTQDASFAESTLVPFVSKILTFYDQHWPRDANGKIRFEPAAALETYPNAVNPLPEIVGIDKVAAGMLELPQELTTTQQRDDWTRLRSELPPVPTRTITEGVVLSPAESYSTKQNSENPELYAVFPYRRYGVGKSDLEMAIRTFDARAEKGTGGWQQDAVQAALLGLKDTAKSYVVSNAKSTYSAFRFPAMWGPNYDWIPDQDHGTVMNNALQRMIIQTEGETILLFPAWPSEWDVEFKVHAPDNTVIIGDYHNGKVTSLSVDPPERSQNVLVMVKVPADINNDFKVDILDLEIIASQWLACTDPANLENCGSWDGTSAQVMMQTGLVYIDAEHGTAGNTVDAVTGDPSSWQSTVNDSYDTIWRAREGRSEPAEGDVYEASGHEDAVMLKTTVAGLVEGSYNVYVYFGTSTLDPTGSWDIQAGFAVDTLTTFTPQDDGELVLDTSDVDMYRALIGVASVDAGGELAVYIDNVINGNKRTWYDGIGYESVIPHCGQTGQVYEDADINLDCYVNLEDLALMALEWL